MRIRFQGNMFVIGSKDLESHTLPENFAQKAIEALASGLLDGTVSATVRDDASPKGRYHGKVVHLADGSKGETRGGTGAYLSGQLEI